jgi:hypothetical protein
MDSANRRRAVVEIALVACLVCAAPSAHAVDDHSSGARCQPDALEKWYCAADPHGAAVVDKLGRVVCAPGECVKQENQDRQGKEDWQCSSTSGGRAEAAPAGPPVCDGKCIQPEATACKKR